MTSTNSSQAICPCAGVDKAERQVADRIPLRWNYGAFPRVAGDAPALASTARDAGVACDDCARCSARTQMPMRWRCVGSPFTSHAWPMRWHHATPTSSRAIGPRAGAATTWSRDHAGSTPCAGVAIRRSSMGSVVSRPLTGSTPLRRRCDTAGWHSRPLRCGRSSRLAGSTPLRRRGDPRWTRPLAAARDPRRQYAPAQALRLARRQYAPAQALRLARRD